VILTNNKKERKKFISQNMVRRVFVRIKGLERREEKKKLHTNTNNQNT
jgi:hypothetical protein